MLRFVRLAAGLFVGISVGGCGGESITVPAPASQLVQAQAYTYVTWSEGPRTLYAVFDLPEPPPSRAPVASCAPRTRYAVFDVPDSSQFGKAEAENSANYRVEPPLQVVSARSLADGITVCLTTAEQAPGSSYEVTYLPTFTTPRDVIEDWMAQVIGFAPPDLLTAIAIDPTHVVAVLGGDPKGMELGLLSNYAIEPALAVTDVVWSGGSTARLTTAEQDSAVSYRLRGTAPWPDMDTVEDLGSVAIVR